MPIILGGHRGLGCTDHEFFAFRDWRALPVENTRASFLAAFRAGADYVELDAVWSADGVAFVLHNIVPGDHFFGGNVPPRLLNTMIFNEIAAFKTGRGSSGEIPTLGGVLAALKGIAPQRVPWTINIELKGVQGAAQPCDTERLLEAVCRAVTEAGMDAARLLFSSFALTNLTAMARRLPGASYALLFSPRTEACPIFTDRQQDFGCTYLPFTCDNATDALRLWTGEMSASKSAVLGWFHPEVTTIRPEHIAQAAALGIGLSSWGLFETLDEPRKALYRRLAAESTAQGVPYTAMTDNLPQMRALTERA